MTALASMTGFARGDGDAAWGAWAWEAKSVNGRGLDVRINLPGGFEVLERAVKSAAAARFKRGNLQIGLRIEAAASAAAVINDAALSSLISAYEQRVGEPPSGSALATLITAKGVVDPAGGGPRELAADASIIAELILAAETLLDNLAAARREEGAGLRTILNRLLDEMEAKRRAAATAGLDQPALIKARLERQLREIEAERAVEPERLVAEVALAAAKADVREELDRLSAHIEAGRAHLAAGSPIGRKLDFLAQELNREANTLCAKSASLELTDAGLALKSLIDQFKEQAANVE